MTNLRSASAPAGGAGQGSAGGTGKGSSPEPGTVLFIGVLFVLVLSGFALIYMPRDSLFRIAPLQVLLGSAVFIALIALVVLVFARLGLYDRGAALGLPDGSVRALIALILLIIFIIFANVIFGQLSGMTTTRVAAFSGLEKDQVNRLPGSVETKRLVPATATAPESWEGTYVVKEPSEDAAALGAQIVTGLLTLVAAISAFYFGSGSVTTGAAAMRSSGAAGPGGLRVLRPSQPVGLTPKDGGGYEPLAIELDGASLGAAGITATVVANDVQEAIQRGAADNQFVYTPGDAVTNPVTLRFTSIEDTRSTVDLVVRVPVAAAAVDPAAPVVPAAGGEVAAAVDPAAPVVPAAGGEVAAAVDPGDDAEAPGNP